MGSLLGRRAFLAGTFTLSWLVVRVAGMTVSDVLFLVAAAATASYAVFTRRQRTTGFPAWIPAAFLVAAGGALASIGAVSPYGSLAVAARVLFVLTVWQWTARQLFRTPDGLVTVSAAYIYGAAVSAVVAVAQAIGVIGTFGVETFGRATGLTGHPNDAGGSLAIAIVLGVALLQTHPSRGRQVAIAVLAVGLLLSASVSGMAAALIGVLFVVVRGRRRIRFVVKAAVVLSLVYVAGTTVQTRIAEEGVGDLTPWARLAQTTGASGEQKTLRTRIDTIDAGLSGIIERPLTGQGLDAESGAVRDDLAVHNAAVLAWYQGGFLFFAGVSIAVVSALTWGLRRRDSFPTPAALTAAVYSMTAPVLYQRYFWLPLVLLACARAVRRGRRPVAVGSTL